MFTGIIEKIGKVSKIVPSRGNKILEIKSELALKVSDSISVNGACLTVTTAKANFFQVEVMAETLKATNIKNLRVGDLVNLERSLAFGDRLGGHFVTGHVDEVGKILTLRKLPGSTIMEVGIDPQNLIYLVKKGSIAIEGVSLTVQELGPRSLSVALIPYTLNGTTLGSKRIGNLLNIEYDLLSKHILNLSK